MPCFIELLLPFGRFISTVAKNFGTIIAAIVALIGIIQQLKENRKWKTKEHNLNLKKEAYVAAIETASDLTASVAKFADMRTEIVEILNTYYQKSSNFSKALLFAKNDLRNALQKFDWEYRAVTLRLEGMRNNMKGKSDLLFKAMEETGKLKRSMIDIHAAIQNELTLDSDFNTVDEMKKLDAELSEEKNNVIAFLNTFKKSSDSTSQIE